MHLPLTGPKGEISQKGTEAEAPGPHPIDSTTRAMSLGAKGTASLLSAAMNGAQQLNGIPASTAGLILTGRSWLYNLLHVFCRTWQSCI